jgi:aspartate/methionine/tyrosine aminotransferase
MNPGDEVLYPNPGYPIYESQIEYFGGVAKAYRYLPSSTGFNIDLDQVKSLITPKTKAIIYNDLQNPIGAESTDAEREAIAELAIKHNLWVLSDEAYFEMRYSGKSKSIAQLPGMLERTVILYTFSKKFAMTGWRLGAAVAPLEIATMIAKLNTNDESCTTHFVQYGGVEALRGDQSSVTTMLDTLRERRDTAVNMLNAMPGVNVHSPEATFYLFPEVTGAMKAKGIDDLAVFAEKALHATGVSFCTRRHFGRPQPGEERQYIRFAFSGISNQDIKEGLELFGKWIAS